MYTLDSKEELTDEKLIKFINKHRQEMAKKKELMDMYKGDYEIKYQAEKDKFKPDNRLIANFAKYVVDTFGGFFMGVPVKITHENKLIEEELEFISKYNVQDDIDAELSKLCSIYGRAYELLFIDEAARVGTTFVSPEECFLIKDTSIRERSLYGVRYFRNEAREIEGTISDDREIRYFKIKDGKVVIDYVKSHYFGGVPLIEYAENTEQQGAFENVVSLINAYNKAISEKANDVDYYADAYLMILGAELDENALGILRDKRIINLEGYDTDKLTVDFLSKPSSDETQENLINRLEKLIFQITMVANINDESFGNTSGISLRYKLQSMNNLAAAKERKFTAAMNEKYKLISNLPNTRMGANDWLKIKYQFTRNVPSNLLEETEIATKLTGITSDTTALSVLSVVDNVESEKERKATEEMEKVKAFLGDEVN